MKILKYKKTSRGRYKLTTDSNELILYEDVILNNNLLYNKDITLDLLEKVLKENTYYEAYDLSLSFIEKKLRTKKEITKYLEGKGFKENIITSTIEKLESINLLNQKTYVTAYTNDKVNLSLSGPYKIKRELLSLGIEESIINEYMSLISNDIWKEKIEKLVKKKLPSLKDKSTYMIKNKLYVYLSNLGYDNSMINDVLSNLKVDESNSIKKEIEKAKKKYSKKYSGNELTYQIKNYLYRKGYNVSDIEI